ncbi:hypothetical protein FOPG_16934 [Fusarium oxysporum f. sp. conglutinans race 2 54008]|uniref:VCBS repeat-containing protein n=4 Tax=Fusarium oxysporum TaxID=5507 RepID=A0A8H6LFE0_FUSOX|nr:hypothetical protein FOXB_15809 [Fusarium oxysporum f. sp. conglutinans Fo5176]EXA31263.1 hypothetical protein FOVG_17440 [Fusarium oxysporum f. sp. pisi HDV247]EXL66919.1 hypothetical protein FOPG_16934 [Fusarium oxysporum f. sp. conglutinans race 2 54008]KAF6518507.1 hypothetical protein HZS61_002585 [Fusarium oxysporum f. sp. conglutinans]KAI8406600.1 hypothetical protein FOFC_14070 [Fusarium oxysporum]
MEGKFCDLDKDELISVHAKGRDRAWINKSIDQRELIGEIAPGFNEGISDSHIEFADVNVDNRADYLIIYGGGAIKAYLNNGNLPNPGDQRI